MWKRETGALASDASAVITEMRSQPASFDAVDKDSPFDILLAQKKKLEELNGWFDIALNNMVRGLSMFDAQQCLIVCNKSYRQIYDLPDELTRAGTPLSDIVHYHVKRETGRDGPNEAKRQADWIAHHVAKLATGHSFSHVQELRDGRRLLVTYQPLANGGWVDIQEDITEKSRTEERIEWLARHDALTGVANRFHFLERFECAMKEVGDGAVLALHWLDLDCFKQVNDTFGHPVGDGLLKAVAARLQQSIRKTDFLARLGGDEFAIIQLGGDDAAHCEGLARRVLQAVSRPYMVQGHALSVGASIGIVKAPEHGGTVDELLKKADIALYNVKSQGRRSYEIYCSGSSAKVEVQRRLETDMHAALRERQFELHYQPILCLDQHRVVGCEALLRWRHPEHGLIAPDDFLPIAERTGEIVDIGAWVLEQACADAATWPVGVKVTVNLSPRQLESSHLHTLVTHALTRAGLDPKRLELDVSEASVMAGGRGLHRTLEQMRDLGVTVTLDDFGRSNASLRQLQGFHFDKVKIDRALIKEAPAQPESAAIVTAVATLARALGILSVAEGVETRDELDGVSRAGCSRAQGYFFSRPVPAADVVAILATCPQKFLVAA